MIQLPAFFAVGIEKRLHVQSLDHFVHEKAKMVFPQHFFHVRGQQKYLFRVVAQKARHPSLSLNSPVDCKFSHRLYRPGEGFLYEEISQRLGVKYP